MTRQVTRRIAQALLLVAFACFALAALSAYGHLGNYVVNEWALSLVGFAATSAAALVRS